MLALSRKKNEALVINNNIEVTVLEIKGDQVKLGITAPKEVPVYRKEVYIPNEEVKDEFRNAVEETGWDTVIQAIATSDTLLRATWQALR